MGEGAKRKRTGEADGVMVNTTGYNSGGAIRRGERQRAATRGKGVGYCGWQLLSCTAQVTKSAEIWLPLEPVL